MSFKVQCSKCGFIASVSFQGANLVQYQNPSLRDGCRHLKVANLDDGKPTDCPHLDAAVQLAVEQIRR